MQGFVKMMQQLNYLNTLESIENELDYDSIINTGYISICYYCDENIINKNTAKKTAFILEKLIKCAAVKNKLYYYIWIDPHAGQIRIAANNNGDVQEKFKGKIVFEKNIYNLISDIYEISSIVNKNGGVKVYIAHP